MILWKESLLSFFVNHLEKCPTHYDLNYCNWGYGFLSSIFYMIQILMGLVLASCHVFYKLVIFGNFNTVLAITESGLQLLFLSGVFISLKNIMPVLSLDFYPVNKLYYIFLMCCRGVSFINTFVFSFYVSSPHVYMMFLFIDPNSKAVVFVAQFFKDHPNALLGFISLLIALYVFIVFKTGVLNILFMCFFPKYSAVGLKRYEAYSFMKKTGTAYMLFFLLILADNAFMVMQRGMFVDLMMCVSIVIPVIASIRAVEIGSACSGSWFPKSACSGLIKKPSVLVALVERFLYMFHLFKLIFKLFVLVLMNHVVVLASIWLFDVHVVSLVAPIHLQMWQLTSVFVLMISLKILLVIFTSCVVFGLVNITTNEMINAMSFDSYRNKVTPLPSFLSQHAASISSTMLAFICIMIFFSLLLGAIIFYLSFSYFN